VQSGRLRAIAVTGEKRSPQLPDVPTVAESGHAGFSAVGGVVLAVPAVTPPETRAALAKLVREAMLTAQIQNHLQANGFVILNSTAEEAQAWIARETRLWSTLIQERRILE
jgi:tripartite-type tricarboxylate transporter receptor subunit TctC